MMRFSRLGLLVFIAINVLLGANCAYYNQVMARRSLVDGSNAYKGRKFKEAEDLFRAAVARDPKGETVEGRVGQLFLARTLHSQFIGNRNTAFGESDLLGDNGLALIKRVLAKADPPSQFIFERLNPQTEAAYKAYTDYLQRVADDPNYLDEKVEPPPADQPANTPPKPRKLTKDFGAEFRNRYLRSFLEDLNKIIDSGQSIYNPTIFGGVALSDFTKQYMAAQPTNDKLVRLNRLVLEEAFPKEIAAKPKAEDAIAEYQKALALDPNDQSSYKAIASLYENLQRSDDWLRFVTERANNAAIPNENRAEALTALAAKKNSCAKEISDTEATKKTITKDGKQAFQFVKPANPEDFEKLKKCVEEGLQFADRAVAQETNRVATAGASNLAEVSDADLVKNQEFLRVFESARSYKASLMVEATRLAEMDGRAADRDRLKIESDTARKSFLDLSDVVRKIQDEIKRRKDEAEAAAAGDKANSNANANKK